MLIYNIRPESVEHYINEISGELDLDIQKVNSPEEVVCQSEFVVTTTPSREPFLKAGWLHPGIHITAVGSDGEHKQELYPEVFQQADRLICDSKSQCFRLGELHHALDKGTITRDDDIIELGELTSGRRSGRQTEKEITICDLTGLGVQDTTIALLTYQKARALGLGMDIAV